MACVYLARIYSPLHVACGVEVLWLAEVQDFTAGHTDHIAPYDYYAVLLYGVSYVN